MTHQRVLVERPVEGRPCSTSCRRSTLLNIMQPASRSLKLVSVGSGYLLSFVMMFSRRKSSHTRHLLMTFFSFPLSKLFFNLCLLFAMKLLVWRVYWWTLHRNVERCSHGNNCAHAGVGDAPDNAKPGCLCAISRDEIELT